MEHKSSLPFSQELPLVSIICQINPVDLVLVLYISHNAVNKLSSAIIRFEISYWDS
jgi:hypothetical protein